MFFMSFECSYLLHIYANNTNIPNEASMPNTFHKKLDIKFTNTCFQNQYFDVSFFYFTSILISVFSIKFAFLILLLSPIFVPILISPIIFVYDTAYYKASEWKCQIIMFTNSVVTKAIIVDKKNGCAKMK